MESKSSNTSVVVIAFTIIIIVAMICGMVVWLMQRSMSMNERLNDKLLEVRLQEAKALSAQAGTPAAALPSVTTDAAALESMRQQLQQAEAAAKREAEARRKAEREMANLLKQQAAKPAEQVAAPAPVPAAPAPDQAKPAPQKQPPKKTTTVVKKQPTRQAPTETKASEARIGSDGYPINRITLPMGNDELDWQL